MAETKAEKAEAKKHDKDEVETLDFAEYVGRGLARVMRNRTAMQGLEAEFDKLVSAQCVGGISTLEVRERLRAQLRDGRLTLESLESRLMHLITG